MCGRPGYGLYYNSVTQISECLPCRKGFYSSGNRWCWQCPLGSIAPEEGAISCTRCPVNAVSVPPTGGTYCQPCGHLPFSSSECEGDLLAPTWAPVIRPLEPSCTAPGYGLQSPENGPLSCLPCPYGWANDNAQSRYCKQCWGNTIAAQMGSTTCTFCPPGSISNAYTGGIYCQPLTPTYTPSKAPTTKPSRSPKPSKAPVPAPTFRPTKRRPTRRPTKAKPTYLPTARV
jgi:hypothetical protein